MGTGVCTLALQRQGDLFAKFTHPADLAGGHANHEGVGFDVFVDYSPCTHKGVFTDDDAADYGAVGAKGGTFLDQGVAVFFFALDQGAGVVHIGKDHAGAAEHAFFERNVVVYADVVLHFAAVADGDLVAHEHVLAEGHAFADFCAATHMDKVPDAGAFADLCALIDDGAGVDDGGQGDGNDALVQAYNEGVDFALFALDDLGGADDVDGFDAVAGVGQTVATSRHDFTVAGSVQVGKPFTEFELFAADVDVAVGGFLAPYFGGQVLGINGQEPAHAGAFVLQIASGFLGAGMVHNVALELAKDEVQHVVKVHSNIGRNAKRLSIITLPAFHVPLATASDIGQFNVKLLRLR